MVIPLGVNKLSAIQTCHQLLKKNIQGNNCFYIYSFMHSCMDSTNTIECLLCVKHCSGSYDYSGMRVSPRFSFFTSYSWSLHMKYWSQALLKLKCSGSCLRLTIKVRYNGNPPILSPNSPISLSQMVSLPDTISHMHPKQCPWVKSCVKKITFFKL